MSQPTHEFKYQKHSEKQYLNILSIAEKLFIEKGIDKVNLAEIAAECGIMRSTFYRYFKNKDEILWNIMCRNTNHFSSKLRKEYQANGTTTLDRFRIFLDTLYDSFIQTPDVFLFIDVFNETYQYVTSSKEQSTYEEVYQNKDFRSGDMVRFLTEQFHDGSVREDLDPQSTAVTIAYSALCIVIGMTKQIKTLPAKYGVNAEVVVKQSLYALLTIILP